MQSEKIHGRRKSTDQRNLSEGCRAEHDSG